MANNKNKPAKGNDKKQEKKPAAAEAKQPQKKQEKKAPDMPPAFNVDAGNKAPEKKVDTSATGIVQTLTNPEKRGSLSPDGRVKLLDLADRRFSRPDATERLTPEFLSNMNMVLDAAVACEIADEAMYGDGTFSRVMQSSMLPQFRAVAAQMGITLPETKALEAITPAEELAKGNVVVKTDKKNLSKATQEQVKKEHEIKKEVPEMDPVKVFAAGEEALKKSITYLLVDTKGIGDKLTGIVDFMRLYRAEEARHAENTADAMLKFDNRTVGEWLDDAFSIVKPTLLFNGIGTGLRLTTSQTGSPVCAFTILKRHIKDQWDDASIASAVTAILRWITADAIEINKKDLALLPEKDRDGEIAAKYKEAIEHNEAILDAATNPTYDFVEIIGETDPEKISDSHKKFRESLRKFVYPEVKDGTYKNMLSNLQQYAGYVTGLFREAGTADANYQLSNMTELVPVEEPSVGEKKEEVKKD